MELSDIRQFFAEEIRTVANIKSVALVAAFAKVPREDFLGPGPWQIPVMDTCGSSIGAATKESGYRSTENADPRHVYHNVAIAIDPTRNLNNGQPGSLATWLDALELKAGDHAVHIGCGLGYYTAIIAEVVGPTGKVTTVELDPDLASRARRNLEHFEYVEVLHADGSEYKPQHVDVIFINAGTTHIRSTWIDGLRPGGRLVLPLTIGADGRPHGMGFMLKVKREGQNYGARFLSTVMIFPCIGSRNDEANQRLLAAVKLGTWGAVKSLRTEAHEPSDSCWLHGEVCLSNSEVTLDSR